MKWDEAVKTGYLNVSPSFLKNWYECETMGIIKTTESSWSNVHTLYGHAYGSGSVELVRNKNLTSQARRITSALIKGLPYIKDYWSVKSPTHGKNLQKLMQGFIDTDIYVQTHDITFHSEEVKVIVEIVNSFEQTQGWLSGTYDICEKDNLGNKVIHDFKAITSKSFYSFKTDMQIPFYTILNILCDMKAGKTLRWSAHSKYIAHTTKQPIPLDVIHLQLGSVANLAIPHMEYAIEAAKKMYKVSDKEKVDKLNAFRVNPHVCEAESFQCEYNSYCAGYPRKVKGFESTIVDDRRPSGVIRIKATEEEILEATQVYKEICIHENKMKKSSTKVLDSNETIAAMEDLLDDEFGL